jgi:hypothetical protein
MTERIDDERINEHQAFLDRFHTIRLHIFSHLDVAAGFPRRPGLFRPALREEQAGLIERIDESPGRF